MPRVRRTRTKCFWRQGGVRLATHFHIMAVDSATWNSKSIQITPTVPPTPPLAWWLVENGWIINFGWSIPLKFRELGSTEDSKANSMSVKIRETINRTASLEEYKLNWIRQVHSLKSRQHQTFWTLPSYCGARGVIRTSDGGCNCHLNTLAWFSAFVCTRSRERDRLIN